MSGAKHTPGPWVVFFDEGEARFYKTERTARFMERSTAETTGGNVSTRAMPVSHALAAPDLLAFAERFEHGSCYCDEPEPGEVGTIQCHPCAAREVLAKVRGSEVTS